jgi:ATP-dependent helicase/nuclease subunit A
MAGAVWNVTNHPFIAAAAMLGPLVMQAPAARPFEFLSGVLGRSRARFVSRLGSEANDAIDALLDRALDYEEANGTSLAGFVNWFAAGEIEIRRNMEQGGGEVRVMTVHGAKGLESHIVILPDTVAAPERSSDPLLMLDGAGGNAKVPLWPVPKLKPSQRIQALKDLRRQVETHEYSRLLYVAMTRARDELYICGYEGARPAADDCWYNTIRNALAPKMTHCGEDNLRLGAEPTFVAESSAPGIVAPAPLPDWIATPITLAPASPVIVAPRQKRAAAQVARGILIHRILQQLPDLAEAERQAHIAQTVQRAGADPSLVKDLTDLVAHPVFAELFSGEGLSEVPLIAEVPGQPPQRRRIDRLVITPSGILVADYKTDRDVPG